MAITDDAYKIAKLPAFSMIMSRAGDVSNVINETYIINGMVEAAQDPFSGNGIAYVKPRPPIELSPIMSELNTGKYNHSYFPYFAKDNKIWKLTSPTASEIYTDGSADQEACGFFTLYRDTANNKDRLIYIGGDTGDLIDIDQNTDVATLITDAPDDLNPHAASMDGYFFVAKKDTDEIYNSDINDISGWNESVNFIRASAEAGPITALTRYKNHIVAFKTYSAEFFFNAGFTGTSPLQRNDSYRLAVGCDHPWSIAQGEDQMFWIGRGLAGNYNSVWMYRDGQLQKISTPSIERQLDRTVLGTDRVGRLRASLVRTDGLTYYIVSRDSLETGVYCIETNQWCIWTFGGATSGFVLLDVQSPVSSTFIEPTLFHYNGLTDTLLFGTINPITATSYNDTIVGNNVPIIVVIQTPPIDFGTVKRKNISLLRFMGSIHPDLNANIRWTDDDGNTWSEFREFPIGTNPVVRNLGQTRRRRFQFTFMSVGLNTPSIPIGTNINKFRLEGFEVEYREGAN